MCRLVPASPVPDTSRLVPAMSLPRHVASRSRHVTSPTMHFCFVACRHHDVARRHRDIIHYFKPAFFLSVECGESEPSGRRRNGGEGWGWGKGEVGRWAEGGEALQALSLNACTREEDLLAFRSPEMRKFEFQISTRKFMRFHSKMF